MNESKEPLIERVPLLVHLTPQQATVAYLVAHGHNYQDIAERLGVSRHTIENHATAAARAIPGDLPTQMKLVCWMRGAPLYVLDGSWLRSSVGDYIAGKSTPVSS